MTAQLILPSTRGDGSGPQGSTGTQGPIAEKGFPLLPNTAIMEIDSSTDWCFRTESEESVYIRGWEVRQP